MIVRRCMSFAIPILLILSVKFDRAERWSRQISNSEWIPLANPRSTQSQVEQNNPEDGEVATGRQLPQIQSLALPPALQHQYQQQLLQLQKTQENIQKLLVLQQQLRAQQQLLQSQAYSPSGFGSAEDKQPRQSALQSHQEILPDLDSEVLVPPLPSSEALPPVFPPQNFLQQRPRPHQHSKQNQNVPRDYATGQILRENPTDAIEDIADIADSQRQGSKRPKDPASLGTSEVEDEEVQLVYVPAETLAQRGQSKRGRGRKQYPPRHQQQQHQQQQQQQRHENESTDSGTISNDQDAFARQLLRQIQLEHEEKTQFLKEERIKEIARLNEEQKVLERKSRLQQEALQREQEAQRQRETEKKRKELEKLEELAKQRELERIREAREKQRQEETERRRLVAEIRSKEERRREEDRLKQQRKEEDEMISSDNPANTDDNHQTRALPLIRDQLHRQHLTEISKSGKVKTRGRPRQRAQYQDHENYRESSTTPSPNQPPLSVYMGSASSKATVVRVSDVLKILKDAKTIAVLDNVGPGTPQVFVGPTNLDPPVGYAKFDLPYLSSIDHNRVERKVDKLPFFVAPLSFEPPPGYSKIPFPAPHIGSVVVNTLETPEADSDQNPNPSPLIEPNSYIDGLSSGTTTPSYESRTSTYESRSSTYAQDSPSTSKYESSYSTPPGSSTSRFRFREYYSDDDKPDKPISGGSYYDDQRPSTRRQKYYEDGGGSSSRLSTEITTQAPRVETSASYASTAGFKELPSIGPRDSFAKEQELSAQLALVNQGTARPRLDSQRYQDQYQQENPQLTGLRNSFEGEELSVSSINDVGAPVGSARYNLPSELPAISPHLPGLVNSLLDKHEAKLQSTSTSTSSTTSTSTSTTTTTVKPLTTTHRPRGRQRNRLATSTRARTTTTEASVPRTSNDRATSPRRPYNRSRSRFTTTTEEYREPAYESSKSRIPETTLKYNAAEHRRPPGRSQKYRGRDKTSQQIENLPQNHNQNEQVQAYDSQSDTTRPTVDTFPQQSGPDSIPRQQNSVPASSSMSNDFTRENYPSSTTENYPSLREVTVNQGNTPLIPEDYSTSQSHHRAQDPRYNLGYEETTLEQAGLERSPVNGFNYQAQHDEEAILQRPKDYQLSSKILENGEFDLPITEDPRSRSTLEQTYPAIYDPSEEAGGSFHHLEREKILSVGATDAVDEESLLIPLARNKQEDYELRLSSTEVPVTDTTTEVTTARPTSPLVIRQRVRARLGGTRVHNEATIQTRPRGSQDEYVRFNVVNQPDSSRSSSSRQRGDGSRTRPRSRPQVQTEGNEFVKFHVNNQQRTSTTPAKEEDVDYGFIRPPNFRPSGENRFQVPATFRPSLPEKYQATPNRRLPGKSTNLAHLASTASTASTTMTITTDVPQSTERIPVATERPDDTFYTARPKSRAEESKSSVRVRGRVRRPGTKKRLTTSTTTESILEAHNELPLDENYPRVSPQVPVLGQQPLFDENYETDSRYSVRNQPTQQYYDLSTENYPPEFVLNFGNIPEQPREEYDQTQLPSNQPQKYSPSTASDIYGAESQWSTKLTRSSFQPSFATNGLPVEARKPSIRESKNSGNVPDIITAAPEASSVTLVVSSDEKINVESTNEEQTMLMESAMFGKKTNLPDLTEKLNATTSLRVSDQLETDGGKLENSTEQGTTIDFEKTTKKNVDPLAVRKGTRRRRVRVRVRPLGEDFVTAESQHFNSALNSLIQDQYKYNPLRESKSSTSLPPASLPQTTSLPQKSLLQDFLSEILKTSEIDSRNVQSNQSTFDSTTTTVSSTYFQENNKKEKGDLKTWMSDKRKESNDDRWNSKKETWVENNSGLESPRDGLRNTEKLDLSTKKIRFPNREKESETFSKMFEDRENATSLEDHPKNHRSKWSEVRYPSSFDSTWNQEAQSKSTTTSVPGLIRKNEGESSVKSLTDYVKAIFDTVKEASSTREAEKSEEITTTSVAGLEESKTEIPRLEVGEEKMKDSQVNDLASSSLDTSNASEIEVETAETTTESRTESSTNSSDFDSETIANLERLVTVTSLPETTTNNLSSSSDEAITDDPATIVPSKMATSNSTETAPGKVLRTSTTTKVSHMTEICYRGRCVMTRPARDELHRR